MKSNQSKILSAICILVLVSGAAISTQAANHTIQVDALGFYPEPLVITDGDFVRFFNVTGTPINVYTTTAACMGSWASGMIPSGYPSAYIEFSCMSAPVLEQFNTTPYFGFPDGNIYIQEYFTPVPTPTHVVSDIPASTPAGLGIMLLTISLLIVLPTLKR